MSGDDEEQGQTQDSHIAYSHAHYSMVNAMNPSIMPHMQQPFYGYRSDLAASQLPLPMNMTRYPIVGGLDGSMGNYLPGSPQFVQPHSYQFPTSYYQPMYEQSQMRSYPIQSRSKLTKAEKINKPNKAKQSDKAYEKKDSRDSRTRKAHD